MLFVPSCAAVASRRPPRSPLPGYSVAVLLVLHCPATLSPSCPSALAPAPPTAPPTAGTWSTHVVSDADGWTALSPEHAAALGSDALPVEVAATAVVSPLLAKHLIAGVPSGSVLLQNLAMSTVGQAVIQYAAAAGVKTVNIMRKHNDWDNRMYHLQGRGATIILDEDAARVTPKFHRLLADLPAPVRALNGAGGSSAGTLLKALAHGGTLVTYGAMSGQPLRVPAGALLAKGITLTGASLERELAGKGKAERDAAVRAVVADVAGGKDAKVVQLVAREEFAAFPAALARALRMGERKVVLRM